MSKQNKIGHKLLQHDTKPCIFQLVQSFTKETVSWSILLAL